MGYDVSFHPISPEEMREWYFTPLTWVRQGQEEMDRAMQQIAQAMEQHKDGP